VVHGWPDWDCCRGCTNRSCGTPRVLFLVRALPAARFVRLTRERFGRAVINPFGFLSGEFLPTANGHITKGRRDFNCPTAAPQLLRRNNLRAAAGKRLEAHIAPLRVLENRPGEKLDGLGRWMIGR